MKTMTMKPNSTTGSTTSASAAAKSGPRRNGASARTKKGTAASTIGDIARAASATLTGLANAIPVDVVGASGVKPSKTGTRVPDQAMSIVQALLASNQATFPTMSGAVITDALAYEAALTPVVQQLITLTADITQTIRERRVHAGKVTLGVYGSIKAIAQAAPTEGFPTQLQQLSALLTTTKKARATLVTHTAVQAAAKEMKVKKVAAHKAATAASAAQAAGGSFTPAPPTAAPAPPTAGAAVPMH